MFRIPLLAGVTLFVAAPATRADPLRCVPPTAQVVLVSDTPRKLAEAVTGLEALRAAQKLPQYRPIYDSATARRGFQLLALFETELGAKWPGLLDQLAGKGVALGFRFGPDPAPAVLVLEGTDAEQVKKATELALKTVEEELARQGAKGVVKRYDLAGTDAVQIGDFYTARVGATTIVSNTEAVLKTAVQLAVADATTDRAKSLEPKARRDAFALLPKGALAWLWLDFASVKESKASKDFFDATRKDFVQTLAAGGTIDCLKRADYIAAGLYREPAGFRLAVRLPAGRSEFPAEYQLHVPPTSEPGTLPLLEPPGTLYSQSFHLDIGYLWKNRKTLANDEIRTGLEKADKDISKVLPGSAKFGELLEMWGPHHRFVVANHNALPYSKEPGQRLPAFGYVATGRDPKFAKSVEPALRAAALIGSLQFGLKMVQHTHEGVELVAYRFPENKDLANDADGVRFNFEPCFALVGSELVVASTVELGKNLITELKRVEKRPASRAVFRSVVSAKGGADALASLPDPLITDAILGRGIGLETARKEVAQLVAWIQSLGTVRLELDIAEKEYKFDLVWDVR
ncbi:hypothetical protein [Frigoriglobus tundricola]|uniref:DUF3352 domain-containing protein n=1 Tax=Frigoriglobus tundricola TaxID=2774151 RepID=A0A6M5YPH0_9BACT|nr:hypothetical protein [Frigoriglobus tundricola]QJW95895.1 hypothetical protein FTUN_3449 [Frigoriglobus tundricola]